MNLCLKEFTPGMTNLTSIETEAAKKLPKLQRVKAFPPKTQRQLGIRDSLDCIRS